MNLEEEMLQDYDRFLLKVDALLEKMDNFSTEPKTIEEGIEEEMIYSLNTQINKGL